MPTPNGSMANSSLSGLPSVWLAIVSVVVAEAPLDPGLVEIAGARAALGCHRRTIAHTTSLLNARTWMRMSAATSVGITTLQQHARQHPTKKGRTYSAMAASLTNHRWTIQEPLA